MFRDEVQRGVKKDITGIHYETGMPVRIHVENGIIAKISELKGENLADPDLFLAPGLIDNQVNGYDGIDFGAQDIDNGKIKKAAEAIWRDGVTSFLPTLVTNAHEKLLKSFAILSAALKDSFLASSIPGFHLEGPYLSKESGFYGCHPVEYLRNPSIKEFREYTEAAEGKIIETTVAPELSGAMEFISICTENNIVVALGHTNASSEQIEWAVSFGARISTHLGNGCANMIHRHLNPLWPQLSNDRLTPSIIADGHHLLPDEIRVFYKVKGPENIILTSDVTYLIGMAPGYYEYMGSRILKTEEGLIKNPELNCLAGASMPLKKGVENMLEITGCRLGDAINMACKNVARVLNLNDRGTLETGKRADVILFKLTGNKLNIKETYLEGNLVYSDSLNNK